MLLISEPNWEKIEKYENPMKNNNESQERNLERILIDGRVFPSILNNFFLRDLQITNARIAVEAKNQNSHQKVMN